MRMHKLLRGLAGMTLAVFAGCDTLDVTNPNEPDAARALADPKGVEALAAGAMQTWFNAYNGLRSAGVLNAQARTYSSSWNNGWLNYHSGVDIDPADTVTSPATWTRNNRPWANLPTATTRTSIDAFWSGGSDETGRVRPGFYSSLAAANNALRAIRQGGLVITNPSNTRRTEAVAAFMQGASLMMFALNYDEAYIVDETVDVDTLKPADRAHRSVVRDFAVTKLEEAAALAAANTFVTDASWTNGNTYTNVQIAQIARTMAAMTLAWYPRDDTENAGVNWQRVADLAAGGMAGFDFDFQNDGGIAWLSEVNGWFQLIDLGRLSTRVAHFLDPVTQVDPYRLGVGSPQPNSPDRRIGDGSFGDEDLADAMGTVPKTANGGTDFAWTSQGEVFRPDRGYYHQSNVAHIRYDLSGNQSCDDIWCWFGVGKTLGAVQNDLIRAEALLRVGGPANIATAVGLIDRTRVGRGGLSSAATFMGTLGSDSDGPCMTNGRLAKNGGPCTLWSVLLYELEIELLGLGAAAYYNQRHLPVLLATNWERIGGPGGTSIYNGPRYIQGLLPGTPREMPVPAKELGIAAEPLYTYGGSANPAKSPPTP